MGCHGNWHTTHNSGPVSGAFRSSQRRLPAWNLLIAFPFVGVPVGLCGTGRMSQAGGCQYRHPDRRVGLLGGKPDYKEAALLGDVVQLDHTCE